MPNDVIATNREEAFVEPEVNFGAKGGLIPTRRAQKWIEEVTRRLNLATDETSGLEPNYVVIDNADSPYAASDNDYILCDMSAGDVDVTLPSSGRLHVSREGASNTLTLIGTVNGVTDPTIVASGDAPALAFIGTEFRYV